MQRNVLLIGAAGVLCLLLADCGSAATRIVALSSADETQNSVVARWGEPQTNPEGEKLPTPLELWIAVGGGPAENAIAWGMVELQTLETDTGESLAAHTAPSAPFDPTKQFVPMDYVSRFGSEHPAGGVRAVIQLKPHKEKAARIAKAVGSIHLKTARKRRNVTIPNVATLVGKTIQHDELKDVGLTISVTRPDDALTIRMDEGDPQTIAAMELVDPDGKAVDLSNVVRRESHNNVSYIVLSPTEITDDAGVRFTLHLDVAQLKVPFSFEDIRIPLPPDSPGVPPAKTDGIPAGLTLGARCRWSDVQEFDLDGTRHPPKLELVVTILGESAQQATAWGHVRMKEIQAEDDVSLKVHQPKFGLTENPAASYIPIDRDLVANDHPENGVRAWIPLEHPSQPIENITSAAGSLKLRIGDDEVEIPFRFENVPVPDLPVR